MQGGIIRRASREQVLHSSEQGGDAGVHAVFRRLPRPAESLR